MKVFFVLMRVFIAIVMSLLLVTGRAQEKIPGGFKTGSVVLTDSTEITGYVREYFRNNASLVLLMPDGRRRQFDGNQLRSAEIAGDRFICLKGDFFKVISGGEICLLQKCSDASSRPVYNGTEAIFINGTEGRRNDYFIYAAGRQGLKLLTAKTREKVLGEVFAGNAVAMGKADAAAGDMKGIKEAVDMYNKHNK